MNKNNNLKVKYIVRLKDDFIMNYTTIKKEFCGSILHITRDSIHFSLNGSNALVIIPYTEIRWLAPSKEFFKQGYIFEDILCD